MAESKRDIGRDRRRIAAGQPYEAGYFARKYGLTRDEGRDIIKQAGNDKANALAQSRDRPQSTR
jgi:hypothetical protein